jgi:uncharacterized repeat protein (TIGR01451 family)
MNISHFTMKKIIQNISTVMVVSALLISAVMTPQSVIASTGNDTGGFPSFDFPGFDFPGFDFPNFGFPPVAVTSCEVTANVQEVAFGGSVTLSWNTTGFNNVRINGQSYSGETGSVVMTNIQANTTYTLSATSADGNSNCTATVSILCIPTPPIHECRLDLKKSVNKAAAIVGDILTYTITIENTGNGDCSGSGVKITDVVNNNLTFLEQTVSSNLTAGYGNSPVYTSSDRTLRFNGNTLNPGEKGTITWTGRVTAPTICGDFTIPNQAKAYAYELNNFQTAVNSNTVDTAVDNNCPVSNPAPLCDSFTATPGTITVGGTAQLAWQTSHATRVAINNGIGEVAVDGTTSVSPIANTTYVLTVFGTDNRTVNCQVPVVVSATPVPVCEFFTATPNSFTNGGGQVTLNWKLNNVSIASISPTIGAVATTGNRTVSVTTNTTFVLTGTDQTNNKQVSCSVPVTVSTPAPVFTCQNNVSFAASDSRINEGDDTVLNWSTTNVDSLSISEINATALSGSRSVDPRRTTTYVLTARKGTESVNCPLTIIVDEDNGGGGGGGGGSVTPRCELTISDNQIRSGEQITLRWNTSNATEMTIRDDRRNIIATTEDKLSRDKKDFLDGSIRLRPTRDTEYTLVAERGSRDRTCKVNVDVEDLTVLTNRDQQPLVAGISLSNVPNTGFEAGPVLTLIFYVLLLAWALFMAYVLVLRRQPTGEVVHVTEMIGGSSAMQKAETIRPDVFVQSTYIAPVATATFPTNLPTGTPMIGYGNHSAVSVNPHQVSDAIVTALENRAHEQKALLSSDAIAYFIATTEGVVERNESLDQVIAEAKTTYPLEDGWIVINESRMRGLCDVCVVNQTQAQSETFTPSVMPTGSSSLAEAIVTGNIIAAYNMIGNRPMFALADAAADFDAVYRNRTGADVSVSDMLTTEAAKLSDEKIKNVITALTGAIDGTYTDEASAVKMAIMKAVKEVA